MSRSPRSHAEAFEPIALADVLAGAGLLDRLDAKYVLDRRDFGVLAERLLPTHRVLEIDGMRAFRYETTYFDTAALRTYRDHVQRRRRRFKCRTRAYVDCDTSAFEVKVKAAGRRTVKHRLPLDPAAPREVSPEALEFLRLHLAATYGEPPSEPLDPVLTMSYRRVTLVSPERGERLTADFDLEMRAPGGAGGRLRDDAVIIESKSPRGRALADAELGALGHRPVRACSKYCLGVALTRPDVRGNRFLPLLRRYFVAVGAVLAVVLAAGPGAERAVADPPDLRITTKGAIPNEPKIRGTLRMKGYRGRIGIERRGQSSQTFPKKSYSLELRDAKGKDRKVALLGMPADGDWVLHGPYGDKSLMRNALAYRVARWMGAYAPRTRFVELRLNGRHQGIYVLIEKPELGKRRVDGEMLFEFTFPFQAAKKGPSFRTPVKDRPIVWEDPERQDLRTAEANRGAAKVRALEQALYGRDPGAWRRHLDAPTAIDYVLVQELFKNQDAFHASTYITLRDDGRLQLGPVWDFDIGSGNSNYGESELLEGWMLGQRDWAARLYGDPAFTAALARRWRELRERGLAAELRRAIADNRQALHGAVGRNFTRWPILGIYVWPNAQDPRTGGYRTTYTAEVAHLRSWLERRVRWIDRHIGALGR